MTDISGIGVSGPRVHSVPFNYKELPPDNKSTFSRYNRKSSWLREGDYGLDICSRDVWLAYCYAKQASFQRTGKPKDQLQPKLLGISLTTPIKKSFNSLHKPPVKSSEYSATACKVKTVIIEHPDSWAKALVDEGIIAKFIPIDMSQALGSRGEGLRLSVEGLGCRV